MIFGTQFKQGEILIVPFPFSNLNSIKQRPVLVLSKNNYNRISNDIIVCGITSNLKDNKYSVIIDNDCLLNGKIPLKSRIKVDKLFTLEKKLVKKKIGLVNVNILTNFVCGIVENSDDGMSGAWFNTRLFYENYSSNFLNCQVSPKENKYCCDTDSIYPQNTWKVGKKTFARVYDFKTGYFADEVNVITTGKAYDVFPNLKLKKAIKVNEPVSRVIISKENNLFLMVV